MEKELLKTTLKELFHNDELSVRLLGQTIYTDMIEIEVQFTIDGKVVSGEIIEVQL